MKKRLLLILLLNVGLTVTPYVNASITNEDTSESYISLQKLKYGPNIIPVGHLNVSVTETIKLKPDIAEFSITYTTEGKSPNDASNRNQNNMKNFKEYLASLNIVDKNLTTIDYQNYEQDRQTTVINENEKYQSSLKINLIINAKEQFPSIFKILDENKINNIKYDSYKNYYVFDIIETGETIEKAKQKANNKYLLILKYLKQLNMDNISILEYDSQAAPQKQVSEKKYYVRNTIKINVTNLENIGKIIAKAQELKMIVNNDINYRVSESATQHAIEQYETTLLNKLNKKASRLLTEQYIVGVPTVLNSSGGQDIEDAMSKNYSYRAKDFNSASSKNQIYQSDSVDIQPPSEFKIILTLSGTFEILKSIINKE